jgi:photosystem II stability/assembly factor-like uncharacterized protein
MRRPPTGLPAAIVAAVVLAGCATARFPAARTASGGTQRTSATSPSPAIPPPAAELNGKYQAIELAVPGHDTSITAISGYAGQSTTVQSWIERSADGGRHWIAGPLASGQHQPGAQAGMAFVSARQGWAYLPDLFFTLDGGATWRAERTPFALTGPVAVAGASTWVVGYGCVRGNCPASIYAADRVGGAPRRLPGQPARTGSVVAMQRPTPSVAWLLLVGNRGTARLVTTADAGRSWATRSLPCTPGEHASQLSATGPGSLWLTCAGAPGAGSVPEVLYRTTDGGRSWTRTAEVNSLRVFAVSDNVAWAVESEASDSLLVRTVDGGRTWHSVLRRVNALVEAFAPEGPDSALAIVRVFSAKGVRFVAYRTPDAGTTWQRAAVWPSS